MATQPEWPAPRRAKRDFCAYCGLRKSSRLKLSKDHFAPKALWGDMPLPDELLTVPACKQCENAFDKDITYFRMTLISMIPSGVSEEVDRVTPIAVKALAKDRREKEKFDRSVRIRPTFSTLGLFTGFELHRELDTPRFHSIAEKIIRAMFYLKNHIALPREYCVKICVDNRWITMPEFDQTFMSTMSLPEGFGDSIFQVRSVHDENDKNVTAWMLYFYQQIGISV